MKCTGGRVVRFLVCFQVIRPSPVISAVLALNRTRTQAQRVLVLLLEWIYDGRTNL